MKKIATHNSATGEKGRGLLSWLVTPFARCQGKSIEGQLSAGCRYFDLRVKKDRKGHWVLAHGLWTARTDILDVLRLLGGEKGVYVMLTYEGRSDNAAFLMEEFLSLYAKQLKNVQVTEVNVKHPVWRTVKTLNEVALGTDFERLDGANWRTLLPLPWLWKKLRHDKTEFQDDVFIMVDFL